MQAYDWKRPETRARNNGFGTIQHYDACDKLGLDDRDLDSIGSDVTKRVHGTVLSTLVKLAKQSGVTPWVALAQFQRMWMRIWG